MGGMIPLLFIVFYAGGFHPPHPLTAERGGAIFGTCLWGGICDCEGGGFGTGRGFRCLMLRGLFGAEDFEYYYTQ